MYLYLASQFCLLDILLLGARIMYVLGTLDRVFDKFEHFLKILRLWFMGIKDLYYNGLKIL